MFFCCKHVSDTEAIGTEEWKQLVLKHENNIKELEAKYKAKCEAIPVSVCTSHALSNAHFFEFSAVYRKL